MARSGNQKLKILYVMDYLLRASDEEHPVTAAQIIDELSRHGIAAERRSVLEDVEALRVYGLDIVRVGVTATPPTMSPAGISSCRN